MQVLKSKASSAESLSVIATVMLTTFVLASLYFAKDVLIPLALSALLTFLLVPLVSRVERWVGRIAAVVSVVTLIVATTCVAGWVLTRQLVDFATNLPEYKENIISKLHAFKTPTNGAFTKFSQTVEELKKELPGGSTAPSPTITQDPGKPETATVSPPAPPVAAAPVQVVETPSANPVELAQALVAPLLGTFGTAALVFVLVPCMLLQREDLRNRLIRLIGQTRISSTTYALDDASQRVSRYLRMQFIVNLTFGVCVAIGLYFIGVPNALLWGALGLVLRFVPYIGPVVALALPTVVALAVSPHWTMPILTVALFAVLELVLNNVMEPLLYGKHTGISSIALIVAAVFWTWLWGPIGLLLATPLTVCLVVMGRHVPRLAFLNVMLSDEEALTPAEDCYHRLLTPSEDDEMDLVDTYVNANSLADLYDSVLIPVISAAETDAAAGTLEPAHLARLEQSVRDIMDELGTRPVALVEGTEQQPKPEAIPESAKSARSGAPCRVMCLPGRAERDELAGLMLANLLRQQGGKADCASGKLVAGELVGLVEKADSDLVCISIVAPSTVIHARYLCAKLRQKIPKLKIIIGLWGRTGDRTEATNRLRDSGADAVICSLDEAVTYIGNLPRPSPT